LALKRIEEMQSARELLYLCAWLAPDLIPIEIIVQERAQLPETLSQALASERGTRNVVKALYGYSLVEVVDGNTISMHRLLQEAIRKSMDAADQLEWASRALSVINSAFPNSPWEVSGWPTSERLFSHAAEVISERRESLKVPSETLGRLLSDTGVYLRSRALFPLAHAYLVRALPITETALGPNHPTVATTLNNLAGVLQDQGDLAGARALFERALAIARLRPSSSAESLALYRLSQIALENGHSEPALRMTAMTYIVDKTIGHTDEAFDLQSLIELATTLGRESEVDSLIDDAQTAYAIDRGRTWIAAADESPTT